MLKRIWAPFTALLFGTTRSADDLRASLDDHVFGRRLHRGYERVVLRHVSGHPREPHAEEGRGDERQREAVSLFREGGQGAGRDGQRSVTRTSHENQGNVSMHRKVWGRGKVMEERDGGGGTHIRIKTQAQT